VGALACGSLAGLRSAEMVGIWGFVTPRHRIRNRQSLQPKNSTLPSLEPVPLLDGRRPGPSAQEAMTALNSRDSKVWNALRGRRREFRRVAIHSNQLSGTFHGFDFSHCSFLATDLKGDFQGSSFVGSDVIHCDGAGGNFDGCYFTGARISGGDFRGASFQGADLSSSIWSHQVGLALANFDDAQLSGTSFINLDELAMVMNLHRAYIGMSPNSVDFSTLDFCETLPTELLNSCALPDWLKRFYVDGVRPNRSPKIFLSYSSADSRQLSEVLFMLRDHFHRPLHDRRDAPAGCLLAPYLKGRIRSSDLVLVLLTARSVRSRWVEREVAWARAARKRILPVAYGFRFGRCRVDWVRRLVAERNVLEWRPNQEEALAGLMRQVARMLGKTTRAKPDLMASRSGL
jgi:hypothetical protein